MSAHVPVLGFPGGSNMSCKNMRAEREDPIGIMPGEDMNISLIGRIVRLDFHPFGN